MKMMKSFVFLFLLCVLLFNFSISNAAMDTRGCSYHSISGNVVQQCTTVLGFLNTTINSIDEQCFMYSEAIYCLKRESDKVMANCTLQHLQHYAHLYFNINGLNFDTCNVTSQTSDNVCSPERLGQYSVISCSPFLTQMDQNIAYQCQFTSYLLSCVKSNIQYLGTTCTPHDIQTALVSNTAVAWMKIHTPSVDLAKCFHTDSVTSVPGSGTKCTTDPVHGTTCTTVPVSDPACTNTFGVFSVDAGVTNCPSFLASLDWNTTTHSEQCSVVHESLVCMHKGMLKNREVTCSLADMKYVLEQFIQLSGIGSWDIKPCQVNDSYLNSDFCTDQQRLVTFVAAIGANMFDSLQFLPDNGQRCSYLQSYLTSQFTTLGCTWSEVLAALTSTYGNSILQSKYPKLNVASCSTSNV